MTNLNPDALAEFGDAPEGREVQVVDDWEMIYDYVVDTELPPESAKPFALWLYDVWEEFGTDDDPKPVTNKQVIDGALAQWCGFRVKPEIEKAQEDTPDGQ